MVLLPTLAMSLLLEAPLPAHTPNPGVPAPTPVPIQCLDAQGQPLPEAMNPEPPTAANITPPKVRQRAAPVWPSRLWGCHVLPDIVVQGIITTKGDLCGATVTTKLSKLCEPFGQAWLDAVKKWKFEPARIGDQPVPVIFVTSVKYR